MILTRFDRGLSRVIGQLTAPGFSCFTLEHGELLIPAGTYTVELTVSGRARKGELWTPDVEFRLPLLMPTPGRTGIRIHAGNTAKHTQGCILLGFQRDTDAVFQSRDALSKFFGLSFPAELTIRERS